MATSKRVTCKKSYLGTQHYNHITGIGGGVGDAQWYRSETQAILNIERHRESYHVTVNGKDMKLVVATIVRDGVTHKYLKSEADGERPDSLINLSELMEIVFSQGTKKGSSEEA